LVLVALAADVDPATGRAGEDLDRSATWARVHRTTVTRSIRSAVAMGELVADPAGGYRFTLRLHGTRTRHPAEMAVRYRFGQGTPPEPAA
jgi:hypothetical protein